MDVMCCPLSEADDAPSVYNTTHPVARKEHRCEECGETIGKGQKYELYKSLYDGHWSTTRTCHLRMDNIWHKPNPMPESVTDRTTKSHEYLFHLSKSESYYYDADAIREPLADKTLTTFGTTRRSKGNDALGKVAADNWSRDVPVRKPRLGDDGEPVGGNKRSVWTIDDPPERKYKSGNKERQQRSENGGNPDRNTNQTFGVPWEDVDGKRNKRSVWTVSPQPYTGAHFATFPPALIEPCVLACSRPGDLVLDPFFGSGTTGEVAEKHERRWIGFDINPKYAALAKERTAQVSLPLARSR